MEHARFWELIDDARNARGKTSVALIRSLAELTPKEIAEFDAWFWAYYGATQREDLWAAVYAIRGGCGDDSFDYFRGWLISRGEVAVLSAIRDPESLVEIIGKADPRDEDMLGAAGAAYRKATGRDLPDDGPKVTIPNQAQWPADRVPAEEKWDDAFYAKTFPKLHARYFEGREPEPMGAIPHARFWEIIDAARVATKSASDAVRALDAGLRKLETADLIGFDRWLAAYNQALVRNDVRLACRILLGRDDADTVCGFRGWLLLQGEAAVRTATHDLDALLEHVQQPVEACKDAIFVTWSVFSARSMYRAHVDEAERETIPDRATWSEDVAFAVPTVEELRARFPRLTSGFRDEELDGPVDVSRLPAEERERVARDLVDRTRGKRDDADKLAQLDQAAKLCPTDADIRANRGYVHAALGNLDAALADLDAALALRPLAHVQWERSKVRFARGDRDGAIADARAVADTISEARGWLTREASGAPKRVRHVKFGEGRVISAEAQATGDDMKLVIEFASGRKTIQKKYVETVE
jgi:tetratricopeptide (TPR) repeat protein